MVDVTADDFERRFLALADELELGRQKEERPIHLWANSQRTVIQAVRLTLTAHDAGILDFVSLPVRATSSLVEHESASDRQCWGFWWFFISPWLRSQSPKSFFKAGAGQCDIPFAVVDANGVPIDKSGNPLRRIVERDPNTGRESFRLEGESALNTDGNDEVDWMARLRRQAADWADCCRALADLCRIAPCQPSRVVCKGTTKGASLMNDFGGWPQLPTVREILNDRYLRAGQLMDAWCNDTDLFTGACLKLESEPILHGESGFDNALILGCDIVENLSGWRGIRSDGTISRYGRRRRPTGRKEQDNNGRRAVPRPAVSPPKFLSPLPDPNGLFQFDFELGALLPADEMNRRITDLRRVCFAWQELSTMRVLYPTAFYFSNQVCDIAKLLRERLEGALMIEQGEDRGKTPRGIEIETPAALEWRFDAGRCYFGDREIEIKGKPYQVLRAAVENGGRITCEALLNRIWGGDAAVIQPGSVRNHAYAVRKVLQKAFGLSHDPFPNVDFGANLAWAILLEPPEFLEKTEKKPARDTD